MKTYKVITLTYDQGSPQPKQMEDAMNTLGKDGWTFVSITLAPKMGIMTPKELAIMVFERTVG